MSTESVHGIVFGPHLGSWLRAEEYASSIIQVSTFKVFVSIPLRFNSSKVGAFHEVILSICLSRSGQHSTCTAKMALLVVAMFST